MMWIFKFIPDFVFPLIALIGIIGILITSFIGALPFISKYIDPYKLPIQIASVLMISFGLYFSGMNTGASDVEADYQARIATLQQKMDQASIVSERTNVVLVEKILENDKIIKDKQNEINKAINKYVTDTCKLSNAYVMLYNSSSQGELPDSTINSVSGTSEITVVDLLDTVTQNNSTYYQLAEQVKGWQEWYVKQKEIFDSVK